MNEDWEKEEVLYRNSFGRGMTSGNWIAILQTKVEISSAEVRCRTAEELKTLIRQRKRVAYETLMQMLEADND